MCTQAISLDDRALVCKKQTRQQIVSYRTHFDALEEYEAIHLSPYVQCLVLLDFTLTAEGTELIRMDA
jgi:hypothetical protein